jgi:hypothetical protein
MTLFSLYKSPWCHTLSNACCISRNTAAHILTPRSRAIFQMLLVAQLVQEIGAFYGTHSFITRIRHWTLRQPSWIESTSCFIHFNTTLLITPRSPKWSLLQVFRIKFCKVFLSPPCPAHSSFDHYNLAKSTKYEAPHYAVVSIFLSLPLSYIQISPQHPVLQRNCVFPLGSETRFSSRIKTVKLLFWIF